MAQYQSASDSTSDGIASVLVARINALRGKTFEYVDGQSNITVFPGEAIFMHGNRGQNRVAFRR